MTPLHGRKLGQKTGQRTRHPQFLSQRLPRHTRIDDVSCDPRALPRVREIPILTVMLVTANPELGGAKGPWNAAQAT